MKQCILTRRSASNILILESTGSRYYGNSNLNKKKLLW